MLSPVLQWSLSGAGTCSHLPGLVERAEARAGLHKIVGLVDDGAHAQSRPHRAVVDRVGRHRGLRMQPCDGHVTAQWTVPWTLYSCFGEAAVRPH